ncbi:MAG TPA: amylo-alpha-1,6-glucosidase [Oligoflexia bacterium]|nr:amylo-alpha-1,6-glucosidase [Oligoflexia bacterium]
MRVNMDFDISKQYHCHKLTDSSGKMIDDRWKTAEWIETDYLGGWSSASLGSAPTRRYHSILMVNETWGRMNYVSQLEELVQLQDETIPLSSNIYKDVIHPDGYSRLFQVGIGPGFLSQFHIGDGILSREIIKQKYSPRTIIIYSWSGTKPIDLIITPQFSYRGFHSLQSSNTHINHDIKKHEDGYIVKPFMDLPSLNFYCSEGEVSDCYDWFYRLNYPEEKKRGLDYEEDLFSMLRFRFSIKPGKEAFFIISRDQTRESASSLSHRIKSENEKRLRKIPYNFGTPLWQLSRSARQCIIKTPRGRTGIVAGYHWFEEWGRDTFLSLPHFLSEFPSREEVYQVFFDFLESQRNGLIPNRFFGANGEASNTKEVNAEYNSVDALLWLIVAARKVYLEYNDTQFLRSIYSHLASCLESYSQGTDYNIKEDESGLLFAGNEKTQLTWMDARVNGFPVTPRYGASVEICAAWYNAKKILAEFSHELGFIDKASEYEKSAEITYKGFRHRFFIKGHDYLADNVKTFSLGNESSKNHSFSQDLSFRPNQLFAISLPHSLLTTKEARALLFNVRDKLLTPNGLRTLSNDSPAYRSHYQGNPESRDSSYHQGTVWPWLFIPYWEALKKFAETDLRDEFEKIISDFLAHLNNTCIGSVSEVFDAEEPYLPGGAASQAWSIAALLTCLGGIGKG